MDHPTKTLLKVKGEDVNNYARQKDSNGKTEIYDHYSWNQKFGKIDFYTLGLEIPNAHKHTKESDAFHSKECS